MPKVEFIGGPYDGRELEIPATSKGVLFEDMTFHVAPPMTNDQVTLAMKFLQDGEAVLPEGVKPRRCRYLQDGDKMRFSGYEE